MPSDAPTLSYAPVALCFLLSACGASDPLNSEGQSGTGGSMGGSNSSAGTTFGGSAGTSGSSAASGSGGAGSGGSTAGTNGAAGSATTGGSAGSGTGGGAGSGGGPVTIPGKCDALGAVDEFQDVTPPEADLSNNGVSNVVADPIHTGTLFAGVDKKGIFKSTDCGSTWVKTNTGNRADVIDSGTPWTMAIDFSDPNVLYVGSLYSSDNSLHKSTNGGVDFETLWPEGSEIYTHVEYTFLQDISVDPTNHLHVIANFHGNCKDPYPAGCISETLDGGATWRLFGGPKDGWIEGGGPLAIGGSEFLISTTQNGFFYTSDSGDHWEQVAPGSDHSMYKTAAGVYYTGSDYGINRSEDGHVWTQVPSSPHGYGMIGDGKRMWNSLRSASDSHQPYYVSDEDDGMTWTPFPTPDMDFGAVYMAYDPDHHVIYGAQTKGGLWRMVTQ